MSRRVLLASGGAVVVVGASGALVEYDVLPGRSRAYDLLGMNGEAGVVPDVEPGPRVEGVLQSEYVDDDPAYWISYPPGTRPGDKLPVVVALHGAGRTAETWCDRLSLDIFLAASGRQMALAAVDGGLTSYWHEREDGQDPRRMVREEFLPLLGEQGLDVSAPGLLGWSMGGLGVLMLGSELAADGADVPVLAVSPALWPAYDQVVTDFAFDDEDQYDAAWRWRAPSWSRRPGSTAEPATRSTGTCARCWMAPTSSSTTSPAPTRRRTGPASSPGSSTWLADRLSAGGAE